MKESDNVDELYSWINGRYEEYSQDKITEEEYQTDLDYYKQRLAELESTEETTEPAEQIDEVIEQPKNVRSTSIAGLRKKLMEEMRK